MASLTGKIIIWVLFVAKRMEGENRKGRRKIWSLFGSDIKEKG